MKSNEGVISYTALPHIHIVGANRCVIDGLKGIVEYSATVIELNLGKYCVKILGDGLHIDSFSHEGAVIEGTIISVELKSC
ncbi:MAG: YabP/YqfC family sporulation protein [Eubacterium sp.]